MTRLPVAVATTVLAALLAAAPLAAHVSVSPGVVERGRETTLRVELPQLRPGPPPTALSVGGPGVRELSVAAAGLVGVESRWRVRLRIDAAPGPVPLLLRAAFADGSAVDVRYPVTVVPARSGSRASERLLAGAAAAAAVASVAGLLLFARRTRRGG